MKHDKYEIVINMYGEYAVKFCSCDMVLECFTTRVEAEKCIDLLKNGKWEFE